MTSTSSHGWEQAEGDAPHLHVSLEPLTLRSETAGLPFKPSVFGKGAFAQRSPGDAKQAVVFVHGFMGRPAGTWGLFPKIVGKWGGWDSFFLSYPVRAKQVTSLASHLDRFMQFLYEGGPFERSYENIVLVGHSLGGVLIRKAAYERWHQVAAESNWSEARQTWLVVARPVLFAPAHLGARVHGVVAKIASWVRLKPIYELLRHKIPVMDQLKGSHQVLRDLIEATPKAAIQWRDHLSDVRSPFKLHSLFGEDELVVDVGRYECDHPLENPYPEHDHVTICKPLPDRQEPWIWFEKVRL